MLKSSFEETIDAKGELFETFDLNQATVWIDPLDGTSDFLKGNLSAVTVLIGLCVNGVSRIGIVHHPFSDENPEKGSTLFGTIEHGLFKIDYDEITCNSLDVYKSRPIKYIEPFNHVDKPADDYKFIVGTSISHFSQDMKNIIETISPVEIKRLGGAGNKCASVALGNTDSYVYPSKGCKYWDLCAPEILVKAMGGYATDFL